jgi:hypothetical protein
MSSRLEKYWSNPWVRRPLLLLLVLAVVFGGCWVIIDRLGRQAWVSLRKEIAAEGETVDLLSRSRRSRR